jgi:hypothetical protein
LKFCLKRNKSTASIRLQTKRFRRDLFIKWLFHSDEETTVPKLYAKSDFAVNPNEIDPILLSRTISFTNNLERMFKEQRCQSNLLPTQRRLLQLLSSSNDLIVMRTDKNLGPALIERAKYVQRAYLDHLSDGTTYRQLTHVQVETRLRTLRKIYDRFLLTQKKNLSSDDFKFLNRTLKKCNDPLSHFYILAKIHKTPWTTRPICSTSGSLLHGLGQWVDVQLQPICARLPTFLSSSFSLKNCLNDIPLLNSQARLCTADAVSMYTNIDTAHALAVITDFLRHHPICHEIPVIAEPLIAALSIIMRHNVFQFGDTYWVQLTGTAMGTAPAPMYATLYYAIKEFELLSTFEDSILFYKRYIDDVFFIWQLPPDTTELNDPAFTRFQQAMPFEQLTWTINPLSKCATFLDLNITILPTGRLDTCLFEKALNLYLYLPATSCHPRSVLKGLIIGLLFRIHRLTSNSTLHSNMFTQVFRRLCLRGYTPAFLLPLFEQAIRYITTVAEPPLAPGPLARPLSIFLHLPFHPDDVNTSTIQRLFRQVFEPTDRLSTRLLRTPSGNTFAYDRLIIAYHRPPNLSNILCPRKFAKTNGASVSTILSSL